MLDLLLRIQDAALQLDPLTIWPSALVGIVMGMFLWLGGTRYSFFVVGILGAGLGGCAGLLVHHFFQTEILISAAIGAVVLAIAFVLLERVVIVLLATTIFALACGTSYMGYSLQDKNWNELITMQQLKRVEAMQQGINDGTAPGNLADSWMAQPVPETGVNTEGESHQAGKSRLGDIFDAIKESVGENKGMLILWILLGATIGLFLAYVLKKVIMAICCSVVGSTSIILGVIALFLAKGTAVISTLETRPKLTPTIFAAMVIFGCICQLIFARKPKTESSEEDE